MLKQFQLSGAIRWLHSADPLYWFTTKSHRIRAKVRLGSPDLGWTCVTCLLLVTRALLCAVYHPLFWALRLTEMQRSSVCILLSSLKHSALNGPIKRITGHAAYLIQRSLSVLDDFCERIKCTNEQFIAATSRKGNFVVFLQRIFTKSIFYSYQEREACKLRTLFWHGLFGRPLRFVASRFGQFLALFSYWRGSLLQIGEEMKFSLTLLPQTLPLATHNSMRFLTASTDSVILHSCMQK